MSNPYVIILAFFSVAGTATMIYGWSNITTAQKRARWPSAMGAIAAYASADSSPDMQSKISFLFCVEGREYRANMSVTPAIAAALNNSFEMGKTINLRYDPAHPETAVVAVNQSRSDWLVIAAGLAAAIFGAIAIFTHG